MEEREAEEKWLRDREDFKKGEMHQQEDQRNKFGGFSYGNKDKNSQKQPLKNNQVNSNKTMATRNEDFGDALDNLQKENDISMRGGHNQSRPNISINDTSVRGGHQSLADMFNNGSLISADISRDYIRSVKKRKARDIGDEKGPRLGMPVPPKTSETRQT